MPDVPASTHNITTSAARRGMTYTVHRARAQRSGARVLEACDATQRNSEADSGTALIAFLTWCLYAIFGRFMELLSLNKLFVVVKFYIFAYSAGTQYEKATNSFSMRICVTQNCHINTLFHLSPTYLKGD